MIYSQSNVFFASAQESSASAKQVKELATHSRPTVMVNKLFVQILHVTRFN